MSTKISVTALLAWLLIGAAPGVSDPAPTFSDPTNIDNIHAPFRSGEVKVYRGRADGDRITVIETHLKETRTFNYNGQRVECCVIEEKEFANGVLVEISTHFVAQDDAGNVRYFGEIANEWDDGEDLGPEDDSWLVGGPVPGDPDVQSADAPAMFMPSELEVGTSFSMSPFGDETLTVIATDVKVRVPGGTFKRAVKFDETNPLEPSPAEKLWVAPGVGAIKERAKGVKGVLIATSLNGDAVELE